MSTKAKNKMITAAAVIAAGGTGTRMRSSVPKQFLEISGKPVLLHTIERIASLEEVGQIVIALPPEHIAQAEAIVCRLATATEILCVPGGANRQESVSWGVAQVSPD